MDLIKEKLKNLPQKSGVYIMYDANGTIIYIGKARILKNRVSQYFQFSKSHPLKVMKMVEKIADFEYIITGSELDALSLESNLIKKHKPHYNILLKDDKSLPYIKINVNEKFPAVEITRKLKSDGAKYFGPYFAGLSVKDMSDIIAEVFPLRTCNLDLSKDVKGRRECLKYHLNKCTAPCTNRISSEDYKKDVDKVIDFLSGKDTVVKRVLKDKMLNFSESEQFEKATEMRDKLQMLEQKRYKLLTNLTKKIDMDLFGYFGGGEQSVICVLSVRSGKVVACKNFDIVDYSLSFADAVSAFIAQYYINAVVPENIIVQTLPDDINTLKEYLTNKRGLAVTIFTPVKGTKKELLDFALKNAQEYFDKNLQRIEQQEKLTYGAVESLKNDLQLKNLPVRIEGYDISNISGTNKVASMVVFVNGKSENSQYRRFKINTVEGANDFASMAEVINRRLKKLTEQDLSFGAKPSLILVDGGKGQLSFAYNELKNSGFDESIDLISLAKREEEVYKVGNELPIILPRSSYSLRLLQRVRDESHRFAITYHRKLRSNSALISELDKIPHIGAIRKKVLLEHFGTLEKIKSASVIDLYALDSISKKLATEIVSYFLAQDKKE